MDRIHYILDFWFGNLSEANLPSADRTELWFGANEKTDHVIRANFEEDLKRGVKGEYHAWEETARGRLALIILFDQLAQCMYRHTPHAYTHQAEALRLCTEGIEKEHDHALTLIERVFFYMPLLHTESLEMQKRSVQAYQTLVELSLPELVGIFQGFLNYAAWHYEVVRRFDRFPQRNEELGRVSTAQELEFLKQDVQKGE